MTIVIDGHLSDVGIAVVGGLITILLVALWQRSSGWICIQLRRAYGWSVTIFTPTLEAARKPRRIAIVSTDGKSLIVRDQVHEELTRQLETMGTKLREQERELSRLRVEETLRKPITSGGVKVKDIVGGLKVGDVFGSLTIGDAFRGVKVGDAFGGVKVGSAFEEACRIRR